MDHKFAYVDNTGTDHGFHDAIMDAIRNDGKFCPELSDIFRLEKTPDGSAAEYTLDWV